MARGALDRATHVHETSLAPFVRMAADAIHRHYPCVFPLWLEGDGPVALPRERTPVFCGSFDWHSAVHGHWALVRALRRFPAAPWADEARDALRRSLTSDGLSAEAAHLDSRESFERPYGLAWLLQLAAELGEWEDPDAGAWSLALEPLERLASERLVTWAERLPRPIRSGEHSQSAFAMALMQDWAVARGRSDVSARIGTRALAMHGGDRDAPVRFEPSGHDFLSPILGAADLLRRVLPGPAFAEWFGLYLPHPDRVEVRRWLEPLAPPDGRDGKLAHLDGLSLTRAWMLEGIVSALPAGHAARPALTAAAAHLRDTGLDRARACREWMGTHWLGSFAVYLLTHEAASRDPLP